MNSEIQLQMKGRFFASTVFRLRMTQILVTLNAVLSLVG